MRKRSKVRNPYAIPGLCRKAGRHRDHKREANKTACRKKGKGNRRQSGSERIRT